MIIETKNEKNRGKREGDDFECGVVGLCLFIPTPVLPSPIIPTDSHLPLLLCPPPFP